MTTPVDELSRSAGGLLARPSQRHRNDLTDKRVSSLSIVTESEVRNCRRKLFVAERIEAFDQIAAGFGEEPFNLVAPGGLNGGDTG